MKCPKCGAVMREKSGRYGRFPGMPQTIHDAKEPGT